MVFVLICTEGDVSEPAFLRALSSVLGGQVPRSVSMDFEILPIPLKGNRGHTRLIEAADSAIKQLNFVDESASTEKWIIVDYDNMDKRGIDSDHLRKDVETAGYTLIINKPNFEFFILAALSSLTGITANTKQNQLEDGINACVEPLNERLVAKGFTRIMLIPPYSKKTHVAEKFFGSLLGNHRGLIEEAVNLKVDTTADCYTEMPKLIKRFEELYKDIQL